MLMSSVEVDDCMFDILDEEKQFDAVGSFRK